MVAVVDKRQVRWPFATCMNARSRAASVDETEPMKLVAELPAIAQNLLSVGLEQCHAVNS